MTVTYRERVDVADCELSTLHAAAFGYQPPRESHWDQGLRRYSLTWFVAQNDGRTVGFVNVIGDGGAHAVLLDLIVDPAEQGHGIGQTLVAKAAQSTKGLGCRWLHVDYESGLADFYERVCHVRPTAAGLIRLT